MRSSVQVGCKKTAFSNAGVLTSAATGLNSFMEKHGVDADSLLHRHGVNQESLSNSITRVPLSTYCSLIEDAARESCEDKFGLLYGSQFRTENLGLLGYLILSSNTLGEALHNLVESFPIHQQKTLLKLDTTKHNVKLNYQVDTHVSPLRQQDAEMSIGCFLNIFRIALGENWAPTSISFEHKCARISGIHDNLFGCTTHFGENFNTIEFNAEILGTPMPDRNPTLLRVMQESLALLPTGQDSSFEDDFVRTVRIELEQNISNAESNLEFVSDLLNLPAWTVKRRLADHGVTFSSLLDDVRKQQAGYYLKQAHVPISEIAFMLGYSEVSALSRAFSRWYGQSPLQWRRSHIG